MPHGVFGACPVQVSLHPGGDEQGVCAVERGHARLGAGRTSTQSPKVCHIQTHPTLTVSRAQTKQWKLELSSDKTIENV